MTPPGCRQSAATRSSLGWGVVGCNSRRSATPNYGPGACQPGSAIIGAPFSRFPACNCCSISCRSSRSSSPTSSRTSTSRRWCIIVATVLQVSIHWLRTRRVNPMHLVSAGFVLVFGGLTLLIHNTAFIMWKPTVVNWLFAAAFLASLWRRVSDRPLIQRMMSASGATSSSARTALAPPQLDVDRLLPGDGRGQPGRVPLLRRRDMGRTSSSSACWG